MTTHKKTLDEKGLFATTKQAEIITPANNFLIRISVRSALIVLERELKEGRNG